MNESDDVVVLGTGAAGVRDSREEALAYLASLSHGLIDPGLAAALVDTGPELIQWLEKTSPVRFGLVPGLFCFAELGPWADRVVRPDRIPRLMLTETPLGGGDGVAPGSTWPGPGTPRARCSELLSTAGAGRCPTTRRTAAGRSTVPPSAPGSASTSSAPRTPPS